MNLRTCLALVLLLHDGLAQAGSLSSDDHDFASWIEKIEEFPKTWTSPHGWITLAYSGTVEFDGFLMDTRAPGLIFEHDPFFYFRNVNLGKLSLGDHLSFLAQLQFDQGFDPGETQDDMRAAFEQYFVRYMPFENPWVNVQVGKFATPVGNWVPRHEVFENPLVRAPLPYDFMTVLGDGAPAPNVTALLTRRDLPDKKRNWLPMIWGPVYHTGIEVFGTAKKFEYAFAVANAALSTRPNQWDLDSSNEEKYNYSGRIGFEPVIGLKLGASCAVGPYLKDEALDDFDQQTFGLDAAYSLGHWEFWAEFLATEWEVPNLADDLRACSYYVETRYKFTPGFYGSLRWGQIFFNKVEQANGHDTRWDRDPWRIEAGLGYFFARNLLGKFQYEHNHQNGDLQQGAHMVSLQFALKL